MVAWEDLKVGQVVNKILADDGLEWTNGRCQRGQFR